MSTFNLPDLGEGLQEAELVTWHVAEGDHVVVDQPLMSVETEKAVVEIPSPKAGHIARLLVRPGERVKVGAPLLEFEEGAHRETGTVVGQLSESVPQPARLSSPPTTSSGVRATPAVRTRAKELGIDLSTVKGSGPGGAITRDDVDAAVKVPPEDIAPLRGARKSMAANMARAWREVAHATLHDDADIWRWAPQEDVTIRLIRAIVAGCAAEPSLNASFDGTSMTLRRNGQVDLGIAIDSPDGLFVPVLRDVGSATAQDLRQRIDVAKQGIAQRSLAPGDLRGATFTLSNFGMIAGRHAALIIMPPQVAILGAGRIIGAAAQGSDRRLLPLSLTFDHRAITGGEAARFLRSVLVDVEKSN
jgi:pyruvate dehydrogenase E2 component (dihydrolipoamide acetyltransferase)